jgi:hypothetical protein
MFGHRVKDLHAMFHSVVDEQQLTKVRGHRATLEPPAKEQFGQHQAIPVHRPQAAVLASSPQGL